MKKLILIAILAVISKTAFADLSCHTSVDLGERYLTVEKIGQSDRDYYEIFTTSAEADDLGPGFLAIRVFGRLDARFDGVLALNCQQPKLSAWKCGETNGNPDMKGSGVPQDAIAKIRETYCR